MTIRSSSSSLRTKGSKEQSDAPRDRVVAKSEREKSPSAKGKGAEAKEEATPQRASQAKLPDPKAELKPERNSAAAMSTQDAFEAQGPAPITPVKVESAPTGGLVPEANALMTTGASVGVTLPTPTGPVAPVAPTTHVPAETKVEAEQNKDSNGGGGFFDSLGDPIGALMGLFAGKEEPKNASNASKVSLVARLSLSSEEQVRLSKQLNDGYNFALSERGTNWNGTPVEVDLLAPNYQFSNSKLQSTPTMAATSGPHLTSMKLGQENSLRMDLPAHEFVHIDQRQIMGDYFEALPESLAEGEAAYVGYKHAQAAGGSPSDYPQSVKTAYLGSMSSDEVMEQLETRRGEYGHMEEMAGALFVDFLDRRYGGDGSTAVKKLVQMQKQIGDGTPFQSAYSSVFKDSDGTPMSYDQDLDLFRIQMAQTEGRPEQRFNGTIFQSSWEKAKKEFFGPWAKQYVAMTPDSARDTLRGSENGFNATGPSNVLLEFVAARDNLTTYQLLNRREDFYTNMRNNQPMKMAFQNSFGMSWENAVDDFIDHLEETEDNPRSRLEGTNLELAGSELDGTSSSGLKLKRPSWN